MSSLWDFSECNIFYRTTIIGYYKFSLYFLGEIPTVFVKRREK